MTATASRASDGTLFSGLRVVDVSGEVLAYTGRMFADLGADVILVEPPIGSAARARPPLVTVGDAAVPVSAHFAFMSAGKRSLALDTAGERGAALFRQLLHASDVVLVPDDLDEQRRRGLEPATLHEVEPRLVPVSATAFGLSGPKRHWRGSDMLGWASSGAMYGIGEPDRPPLAPGGGLAHASAALNAAFGTVLALRARRRAHVGDDHAGDGSDGGGQVVDVSVQEAVLSVSMEAGPLYTLEGAPQRRVGHLRRGAHGVFPVQDGMVEIVAYLPGQWDAMARWIHDELGVDEVLLDEFRDNRMLYGELIESWVLVLCSRYGKADFFHEAQRRCVPCGPINDIGDVLDDVQLEAVGAWSEVAHPDTGTLRLPRAPVRVDEVVPPVGAVPRLGEHSDAVLRDVLGLDDDEIRVLRRMRVVV
jgi:benzylsuccinate CoA-transferase BbsE subunit